MHLFKFIFAATAASVLCASCTDPTPVPSPVPDDSAASFVLLENSVDVPAAGGDYSLPYTLENGIDDRIVFECSVDWINGFKAENGIISFHVNRSDASKSRIITFLAGYGNADNKIIVNQQGFTGDELTANLKFDFDLQSNGPKLTINVKPTINDVYYYFEVQRKTVIDKYLNTGQYADENAVLRSIAESIISDQIKNGAYYGQTTSEIITSVCSKGPDSDEIECVADTDYYVFAFGVSLSGQIIGNLSIEAFRSGKVDMSDNKLEVFINEVNSDRIKWSVKTTNNDPYIVKVLARSKVDGKTDSEIVADFYNEHRTDFTNFLHYGNADGTNLSLAEDADYYLCAFGFDYGTATTAVQSMPFHTLISADSKDMTWAVEMHRLTNYRAIVSVCGTPETALYLTGVTSAENSEADILAKLNEEVDTYVQIGYAGSRTEWLRRVGTRGEDYNEYTNLIQNSDYWIYCVPVNEKTGEIGPVKNVKSFKTPAAKESTAYIDVNYDKFFDGTTVYNRFKDTDWGEIFAGALGSAIVPVEIEKHGDCFNYMYDIYTGDLTGTPDGVNIPTDHQLIVDLQVYGTVNMPKMNIFCSYGQILTVVSVARDSEDNYGKVIRRKIMFDEEDASPVTEFDIDKYVTK